MADSSERKLDVEVARRPRHIAVIMDGNGRWAKARGLPRLAGHRAGTQALRRVIEACIEFEVPYLTIYAFSTENWKRPAHEVRGLMFLLEEVIERQLDELDGAGVRIRHIGWLDQVPRHLQQAIQGAVERTAGNRRLTLSVAFNYGARAEIVRAVRRIVAEGIPAEAIDEATIEAHLETAGMPDPDMVIRTSGELRLSNYLLWQVAYAEIYPTEVLWPDFGRESLIDAIESYAGRERRFGARPALEDGNEPSAASADPQSAGTTLGDRSYR
ncbi:MAG: di-trans,poly-cis-decaprenylcistransferase [Caldilineae bacterium]|nr:di-trans,poly-cis-decaprenylcistransferase [Caldilineae bacterium]